MSTTTSNLGLTKPAGSDYIDISVLNANTDILDNAVTKIKVNGAEVSKASGVADIGTMITSVSGVTDETVVTTSGGAVTVGLDPDIVAATTGAFKGVAVSGGTLTFTKGDGTTTAATIPDATTSASGLMTSTDKTNVNNALKSAVFSGTSNPGKITFTKNDGTTVDVWILNASSSNRGLMTPADAVNLAQSYKNATLTGTGTTADPYKLTFTTNGGVTKDITWTGGSTLTADRGLTIVSDAVGHSNTAVTAVTTAAPYKIAFDQYGHITGYSTLDAATATADGLMASADKTSLNASFSSASITGTGTTADPYLLNLTPNSGTATSLTLPTGGSGTITSVTGTSGEITATTTSGAVVIGLDSGVTGDIGGSADASAFSCTGNVLTITDNDGNTNTVTLPVASTGSNGSMSAGDKVNLSSAFKAASITAATAKDTITFTNVDSSTDTVDIPAATTTAAGVMTSTDKTNLNGSVASATYSSNKLTLTKNDSTTTDVTLGNPYISGTWTESSRTLALTHADGTCAAADKFVISAGSTGSGITSIANTDGTLDPSVTGSAATINMDSTYKGYIDGAFSSASISGSTLTLKKNSGTDVTVTLPSSSVAADRGLSVVSDKVGHSNTAITAVTTEALYQLKFDAYGHITGYTPYTETVQGAEKGLSITSNKVGHSNTAITAQTTEGLQSITYDAYGHITAGTAKTLGRGLDDQTNVIGHSNTKLDPEPSVKGVYKIKADEYGHITEFAYQADLPFVTLEQFNYDDEGTALGKTDDQLMDLAIASGAKMILACKSYSFSSRHTLLQGQTLCGGGKITVVAGAGITMGARTAVKDIWFTGAADDTGVINTTSGASGCVISDNNFASITAGTCVKLVTSANSVVMGNAYPTLDSAGSVRSIVCSGDCTGAQVPTEFAYTDTPTVASNTAYTTTLPLPVYFDTDTYLKYKYEVFLENVTNGFHISAALNSITYDATNKNVALKWTAPCANSTDLPLKIIMHIQNNSMTGTTA